MGDQTYRSQLTTNSDNQSSGNAYVYPIFLLDRSRFTVPINGFLMPLIAVVTLVNNSIVVAILLRRQMRSPTNALLAALAVSDTMTIVCPVPCFVHFYTLGQRYLDWVPYSWCFAYFCLTDYLPTVFHTASIWLTTSLAGSTTVVSATAQGHCGVYRKNDSELCFCSDTKTMSRTVDLCVLMKLDGGLSRRHSADDDAVQWLANRGR